MKCFHAITFVFLFLLILPGSMKPQGQSLPTTGWTRIIGPYVGTITAMSVVGKQILVATNLYGQSVGMYRSTDNGKTWSKIPSNSGFNSANPVIKFLVIDNFVFAATYGSGIYRSGDSGLTWTSLNTGLTNKNVTTLGAMNGFIFAGVDGNVSGIFRSSNFGLNWEFIPQSQQPNLKYINCIAVNADSTFLFAGASWYGLYRSSDNGVSWDYLGFPNSINFSVAVKDTNIFLGFDGGCYRSTNNGTNWGDATSGLNSGVLSLMILGDTLYAGTSEKGVYKRSLTWGASWTPLDTLLGTCLSSASKDSMLFIGTGKAGLFYSDDFGRSWISRGVIEAENSFLVKGDSLFSCINGNIFFSKDNGLKWKLIGYRSDLTGIAFRDSTVFALTWGNGIYQSTDFCKTWIETGLSGYLLNMFAIHGGKIFVGMRFDDGLFVSEDNGFTWSPRNNGLTSTSLGAGINALVANESNLFVSSYGGGVFVSSNEGASWNAMNSGILDQAVSCLMLSDNDLLAGTYTGVYRYRFTDISPAWIPVREGMFADPTQEFWSFLISSYVARGNNIFAATGFSSFPGGIFVTTNNGDTWKTVDSPSERLSITANDSYIYAIDYSNKWYRPLSEVLTMVTQTTEAAPSSFALSQNYPNPFNPTTKIRYSVPLRGFVRLTVYNTLGQLVRVVDSGTKEPGEYEVSFDGSNLSSGIYFYRLESNSFISTKKFVLLK